MTNSDNDSLLSYIAVRHTVGMEDVATDALSFILNRSASAMTALSEFLGSDGKTLPIASANTQEFLESSGAFPDMALRDSDDNLTAFVESKFWAQLTHNQPVTYWEALPTDRRTVLLFLVPQYRVEDDSLWNVLVDRLKGIGHELGTPTRSKNVISAASKEDQRRLVLTSWEYLLQTLADRVEQAKEARAVFEIAELQALASAAVEGKRDTQNDEFKLLLAEAVATLRESGWANTERRTVGQGFGFYGRYLRLAGAEAWLGTVDEVAKQDPDKQLWLSFADSETVSADMARKRLASRAESRPGLLSWMRVHVPIPLSQGADWETSLNAIVNELESIARLIDPDGPTYR